MPKSRKRKGAKKPKQSLIKRVGDKKYITLLDEHGHPRVHELPEVKRKKKS